MPELEHLFPLQSALRDLVEWLNAFPVRGVIIGGVAASILGRPRATQDVDAVVLIDDARWSDFLASGEQFGISSRRPDVLEFARRSRVLLLRHESTGIQLDISIGALPFEIEMIDNAHTLNIGGIPIPLPSAEDLIILKSVAHRPKDLADIEGILEAIPKLNLNRIRRWVRDFSNALELPEIYDDLQKILSAGKTQKHRAATDKRKRRN